MHENQKMLLVAETVNNTFFGNLQTLIGCAQSLGFALPDIYLVLTGQHIEQLAEEFSDAYNLNIILYEHEEFIYPNPNLLTTYLLQTISQLMPSYVSFLHTPRSCQITAALSHTLRRSCITNIESITLKEKPIFKRSLYQGKLVMELTSDKSPLLLTIQSGAFSFTSSQEQIRDTNTRIESQKIESIKSKCRPTKVTKKVAMTDCRLEEADVIVSAGKGIRDKKNLEWINQIVQIFKNAAIGGSRVVCDAGWLPYTCQVGETGRQVAPKVYIACGISGAQQHIAGMKNSQWIVAINNDPQARIFSFADVGVIEDLTTFLPILVKKYKELTQK